MHYLKKDLIISLISLFLIFSLTSIIACNSESKKISTGELEITFKEESLKFSDGQKVIIGELVTNTENEVRKLLPKLPKGIEVNIEAVDWDLNAVGGVTGRTESNSPPLVLIQISKKYREGIIDSVKKGIKSTIFHEFHHLSRGWAIQDNKFSYGIPNAMVNEGLAVAFTEINTGIIHEVNSYNDEADIWVKEILDLPKTASYSDWVMGEHPDGRTYIGYRAGNYIARKAMNNSGKNILELSSLSPKEIIKLAGY